ncbi:MAG: hypothetical protein A2676_01770 [Candidatus Sungbacteria bacterium RIFCSPHIGHO2_01_FULL_51_22]|nr:MAG: hypothetical protein A2676_01770 [Candidatus Sungbacteria bacterium RIFCSPHIGHO2_01_FULL_51_22]
MVWPWQKRQPSFFELFESHANIVHAAADLLKRLLDAAASGEPASGAHLISAIPASIKEKEHEADVITHVVMRRINTEFITPIDKEDIRALTQALDDVVDYIYKASKAFATVYELQVSTPEAQRLSATILDGTKALVQICRLLKHPRKNADAIRELCIEIHRLENMGDEIKEEARRGIFGRLGAQTIDLPLYLAWADIYNLLEIVTDKAEDCANVADQILMKHS